MRVLQLCSKPPLPAVDGGCLAMHSITQGLLDAGHDVRVLSIATPKHPDRRGELEPSYLARIGFDAVFVDTRVRALAAARNLLGRESYNITRFRSSAFREKLLATLRAGPFDVVQIETLPMLSYLNDVRANSSAKVIYRAHNVEHQVWERLASGATGLKRQYLRLLARRLRDYEKANINASDAVAAITGEDVAQLSYMGCVRPLRHIPFALSFTAEKPTPAANTFFHIGAMDWQPNIEAIRFLLNSVWPLVRKQRPGAILHLAGRKMPAEFRSGNGVVVDGEVDDAGSYMRTHGIMMAPLLSGGGMRIKVIEAMAQSRPVISTPVGLEGVPVTDGVHAAVGETAEELALAAVRLCDDAMLRKRMGEAARQMVMQNFSRSAVTGQLVALYEQVLEFQAGNVALFATEDVSPPNAPRGIAFPG